MNEILLKIFSISAIIIICIVVVLFALDVLKIKYPFKNFLIKNRLELLFLITLFSTVGSILLSIYFKFAACELCWYQRIFLFTLPIISAIGIIKKDSYARLYIFVLSLIGLCLALYHSLLQSNIFIRDSVFCNPNAIIDCSIPYFTYFGFVTIPVISSSIFFLILYISYVHRKE